MDSAPEHKPITPRRLQRMASVLARRQPDVAIVLEDVHDPHNVSAVLRSCDATGVADVRLVYDVDAQPELSRGVSAGARRWLETTTHPDIESCYRALRHSDRTIYATTLTGAAHNLYEVDLTGPCAFVFGNESRGLSAQAIASADACLHIPMMGMAESLNISVACAVTLFETLRQRHLNGCFDAPAGDELELRATLARWLERDQRDPELARSVAFDPGHFPLVWPRTKPPPEDGAER